MTNPIATTIGIIAIATLLVLVSSEKKIIALLVDLWNRRRDARTPSLTQSAEATSVPESDAPSPIVPFEHEVQPGIMVGAFALSRLPSSAERRQFIADVVRVTSPWDIEPDAPVLFRRSDVEHACGDVALLRRHVDHLARMGIVTNGTGILVTDSFSRFVFLRIIVREGHVTTETFLTDAQCEEFEALRGERTGVLAQFPPTG